MKEDHDISKKAIEMAAKAWTFDTTKSIEMDVKLATAFAIIISEYREALIWCSGSDDFLPGGKARLGWEKICKPLI